MTKRIRRWNEATYRMYLSKGRGQGEGPSYLPWVRVQDFASRGTISRIAGIKTGRTHHFMSSGEKDYFYLLEWSDKVVDIREQFPLLDVASAMKVAEDAGIRYPLDNVSGFPYVLTCDFMITTSEGRLRARTVKLSSELSNRRTLEKLEIERRYWEYMGIDWRIVTEHELPRNKIQNIKWLHTSSGLPKVPDIEMLIAAIKMQYKNMGSSIYETAAWADSSFLLSAGSGLQIIKHMLWTKQLSCDIDTMIMECHVQLQASLGEV